VGDWGGGGGVFQVGGNVLHQPCLAKDQDHPDDRAHLLKLKKKLQPEYWTEQKQL
jgi:hypothetical protein